MCRFAYEASNQKIFVYAWTMKTFSSLHFIGYQCAVRKNGRANEVEPGRTGCYQESGRTGSDHIGPGRVARSDPATRPTRAAGLIKSDRTGSGRFKSGRTKSNKVGSSQIGPSRVEQGQIGPDQIFYFLGQSWFWFATFAVFNINYIKTKISIWSILGHEFAGLSKSDTLMCQVSTRVKSVTS